MSSANFFSAKEHRKARFAFRLALGPLITATIVLALIFFHQKFLVIKSVSCSMQEQLCPEAIINILDREIGNSFLRLNTREIEIQTLSTGLIENLVIKTQLPGKLNVLVTPPALTYIVKTAFSDISPRLSFLESSVSGSPILELTEFTATTGGKTFRLLSTGVLSQADETSSLHIIAKSIPSRDYLIKTFGWLHSLSVSSMKPETIFFFGDMIILKERDQPDLVLNFSDNPASTLLALQRVNEIITMKKPTVIDFRFSHLILK